MGPGCLSCGGPGLPAPRPVPHSAEHGPTRARPGGGGSASWRGVGGNPGGVCGFGSKYRSKKECYYFMAQEVKSYQPPQECVTIFHLRDQMNGKKGYIKATDVKILTVPHYEELSIGKILAWTCLNHREVRDKYLPNVKELSKMPRQVSSKSLYPCHTF